jgi:hypothetical protein
LQSNGRKGIGGDLEGGEGRGTAEYRREGTVNTEE